MTKQVKQYIKNPKYGQPGEPERILVPQMISENGAFLNRMAQIEKLEYNATQVTGNNYNGLAEALASVTNDKYKVKGIVLTWFDSAENQWKSMRYNGTDSTGWSEVDNWVDAGVATGASEHTLDLSPLFNEEGNPVATVSDKFLAEVKKAYEEKYSNVLNFFSTPFILSASFGYLGGTYIITTNLPSMDGSTIALAYATIGINESTKAVQPILGELSFNLSGSGTKALTDNGQYAEFVPEAPADGKTYSRNNKQWVETSSGGTQYLDLSMFSEASGTLSEENYQKVVKAYNDKENVFSMPYGSGNNIKVSGVIDYSSNDKNYSIVLSGIAWYINASAVFSYTIVVKEDKSYTKDENVFTLTSKSDGTKALTDNGLYAEFAKPIKTQDGGTGAVTKELQPNTFYKFGECSSLTITLAAEKSGILNEYMFEFISGSTPTTLADIPNIKWQNGDKLVPEANCTYQVSIVNNCAMYAKFPNA